MRKTPFRFVLMLLALTSALVARLLLEGKLPMRWVVRWPVLASLGLGCGLLLAALVVFGLAAPALDAVVRRPQRERRTAPRQPQPDARIIRPEWARLETRPQPSKARWIWLPTLLLLAAVCYVASLALWYTQGETLIVRLCWLAGITLLLLSQLRLHSLPSAIRNRLSTISHRPSAIELALLALILVVAFALRFYRVEVLPFDMHGDMASHGFQARELIYGAERTLWRVGYGEVPMLGYAPMAVTLRLFGDNLFGLRMSAVIEGTLSVLGLYLLARELYGRRVALLAASFLTISYVHIHFSRVGQFMDILPWIVFALYFLVRGLKRRSHFSFALCGVLLGLGLQMYYASRILLVLVPLFIAWRWLVERKQARAWLPGLLLLVLGFLFAFGPMLLYGIQSPDMLVGRANAVTLFNPNVMTHLQGKYGVNSAVEVLREQAKRSLLTFYRYGDASTHFSLPKPFVAPLVAALFTLGLGYVIFRPRRMGNLLLAAWLLLTLLLGSVLTNDAPTWPHIVGLLLPLAMLAALAVDRLWAEAEGVFDRGGRVVFTLLTIVALLTMGVSNWRLYTDHASGAARPRTRIGRYLAALPAGTQSFIIGDPLFSHDREIRFLVGERPVADVREEALRAGDLPTFSGPAVFIVTPNHAGVLELLQQAYPGGVSREHREPTDYLAFFSFEVRAGP